MLSALPEPDPMPAHLVERINASLAAEQAERAAGASSALVTPLISTARRRPQRLHFALAGAAAAVALIAVVSSNLFTVRQDTATSGTAALARPSNAESAYTSGSSNPPQARREADTFADSKAAPGAASPPSLVQIRESHTRYTQAGFVAQARTLRGSAFALFKPTAAKLSGLGAASSTSGLTKCLSAIGFAQAKEIRADVALYEGQRALIIVATKGGIPMAVAVGLQCPPTGAAVLHPATPLL